MRLLRFIERVLYVNYMAKRAIITGEQPSQAERLKYL